MFQKGFCSFLCVLLLVTVFPLSTFSATPIEVEGNQGYPIYSDMETAEEAAYIHTQLTPVQGSASLSQDCKNGKYAAEVKVPTAAAGYAQFTLVNSNSYNSGQYGEITLSVKPKAGAKWIRFYTNTSGGAVILKSDQNADGCFEVGTDWKAGEWNQVTLRLMDGGSSVTSASALIVQANSSSTWGFDAVRAEASSAVSLDLNRLKNNRTVINNGKLQFASNGTDTYDVTPTVLISGREVEQTITHTTQADFAQGLVTNGSITASGEVTFNAIDTGVAISGGDYSSNYSKEKAFDNNVGTYWASKQLRYISNVAYLGKSFNEDIQVDKIGI